MFPLKYFRRTDELKSNFATNLSVSICLSVQRFQSSIFWSSLLFPYFTLY